MKKTNKSNKNKISQLTQLFKQNNELKENEEQHQYAPQLDDELDSEALSSSSNQQSQQIDENEKQRIQFLQDNPGIEDRILYLRRLQNELAPSNKISSEQYDLNKMTRQATNYYTFLDQPKTETDKRIEALRSVTHNKKHDQQQNVIDQATHQNKYSKISEVLGELIQKRQAPESYLTCHLIDGLSQIGEYDQARSLYSLYQAVNPRLNYYVNNTMIKTAEKHGAEADVDVLKQQQKVINNPKKTRHEIPLLVTDALGSQEKQAPSQDAPKPS